MFTTITDANYSQALQNVRGGVLLFFKKLCPHCKNMEKVLEKFHAQVPDAQLLLCDIEESVKAAAEMGAERPPTLFIVREGKVVASKAGLMNPKELIKMYTDNPATV